MVDMFIVDRRYTIKSIEEIPSNTTIVCIDTCPNLQKIKSFPASVKRIMLAYLPSLKCLPPLPQNLESIVINGCPQLVVNDFPPHLHTLDWYGFNPYELPMLPYSIKLLDLRSSILPEEFSMIQIMYHDTIMQFNKKIQHAKINRYIDIIKSELLLKAISPERVAKWLGSEEDPQWELLDSILGID